MARLPYPDPAALSEEVRSLLEQIPVKLNIFRMIAHAETSFRPFMRFGASILAEQKLSAKLRELVILHVATLSPSQYEWVQHVPIAHAAAISDAQIAAIERGDIQAACFDPAEKAVLAFASDVLKNVRASDATLAAVRQHLSDREVVEVIFTVGNYMMVARLLETTGVDLDKPAGTTVVDSIKR